MFSQFTPWQIRSGKKSRMEFIGETEVEEPHGLACCTQAIFDTMVAQAEEDGMTLQEASLDTLEMLGDLGSDTSGVYMYTDEKERDAAKKTAMDIDTLHRCSKGQETFVNATFAMQTLAQGIQAGKHADSSKKLQLIKGSRCINAVLKFLKVGAEEQGEGEGDKSGGGASCGSKKASASCPDNTSTSDSDSDSDSDSEGGEEERQTPTVLFIAKVLAAMQDQLPSLVAPVFEMAEIELHLLGDILLQPRAESLDAETRLVGAVLGLLVSLAPVGGNAQTMKRIGLPERAKAAATHRATDDLLVEQAAALATLCDSQS